MSDDDLLTTAEAAKLLRVSRRTVEAMRARGTGPNFCKYGDGRSSPIVYRRSALMAWVAERERQTPPDPPASLSLHDLMERLRSVAGLVDAAAWCPIIPHEVSLVALLDIEAGYIEGTVEAETRAWHPAGVAPRVRVWATTDADTFRAMLRDGSGCTIVRLTGVQ